MNAMENPILDLSFVAKFCSDYHAMEPKMTMIGTMETEPTSNKTHYIVTTGGSLSSVPSTC
eukprot:2278557-Amphidinium_carterae.1